MRRDLARVAANLDRIDATLRSVDRTLTSVDKTLACLVDVLEFVTTPVRLANSLTRKFL